jgi:hypothetical protein
LPKTGTVTESVRTTTPETEAKMSAKKYAERIAFFIVVNIKLFKFNKKDSLVSTYNSISPLLTFFSSLCAFEPLRH